MDDTAFDRLVQMLSAPAPRRNAVRSLLIALLAGSFIGESEDALAGSRPGKGAKHRGHHKNHRDEGNHSRTDEKRRGGKSGGRNGKPDKGKSKGKNKDECAKTGEAPRNGKPCCKGLVADISSNCSAESAPAPNCVPQTCAGVSAACGTLSDGCGGTLDCGSCTNPTPVCAGNSCRGCTDSNQCSAGQVCCGGSCEVGICCEYSTCLNGETCLGFQCLCAPGNVVCGQACIDVDICCNQGVEEHCTVGQTCCSPDGCRNLQVDADNCGACGARCIPETFTRCDGGVCKCEDNPACTDGKVCKETTGDCVCPDPDIPCAGTCPNGSVSCGEKCLICPPPPPGIILPGPPVDPCCYPHAECSCGGNCCKNKDDCFQTIDSTTHGVVKEFCCSEVQGGVVCGDQCCKGDCANGCVRLFPVGGSYRRPGG